MRTIRIEFEVANKTAKEIEWAYENQPAMKGNQDIWSLVDWIAVYVGNERATNPRIEVIDHGPA